MKLQRFIKKTTRLYQDLPQGEIIVVPPPMAPTQPSVSLITILLPLGGTLVGFAIMAFAFSSVSNGGNTNTIFISLGVSAPMILISYVTSFVQYTAQRKKYKVEKANRIARYNTYIGQVREELVQDQQKQRTLMLQVNPSPSECIKRVETIDSQLWERSPRDTDFLSLRVGLGKVRSSINLRVPHQDPGQVADPLIADAMKLEELIEVKDCPILFPLNKLGIGGICGERSGIIEGLRSLILQISTHHSSEDVKIAAIFPKAEYDEWAWMRWLPHTWSDDRKLRYLACGKESCHNLMLVLYEELKNRQRYLTSRANEPDKTIPFPTIIIFLADTEPLMNEASIPTFRKEGPALGIFLIYLADQLDNLPPGCKAILKIENGKGKLILPPNPSTVEFLYDKTSIDQANEFARSMAPIQLEKSITAIDIPTMVPLLEVIGVDRVEEIPLIENWAKAHPEETLTVVVGKKAGGEPFCIDLHEPKGTTTPEQGHGPHGLVAGETGYGKSEFLQALIVSLAVKYHPRDVAFVLFDFGLGATFAPLKILPHVINYISNLDLKLVPRALTSLTAEFRRRQELFNEANVKLGTNIQHIDEYISLYQNHKVTERLPYLVLIVDEFAILKSQLPDELDRFVQVAILGRKYGFRMILAAQQPAGIVSYQIQSNTKFRICFKVENAEDSKAVINRSDANLLAWRGRAYFSVGSGQDEVFECFQSALSSASYQPGVISQSNPTQIIEVTLEGQPRAIGEIIKAPSEAGQQSKQIQAVVSHIQQVCEKEGIERQPPVWHPLLPEYLPLDAIRPANGWNGHEWLPSGQWLSPVIGKIDDPENQKQPTFRVNLGKEGSLIIYGAPNAGKKTLLQTLILSMALDHSPEDLNIYILDLEGHSLQVFQELPHVGEIITTTDDDRLKELFRFLLKQIKQRKQLFFEKKEHILNYTNYRDAGYTDLPVIVVVLSNYASFKKYFPDINTEETLRNIIQEGNELGIHFIITANSTNQISSLLTKLINMNLALQLPPSESYGDIIEKAHMMKPAPFPGRGLVKGPCEFQTALPVKGEREAERGKVLSELVQDLRNNWTGQKAPRPGIPKPISLSMLLKPGYVEGYPKRFPLETFLGYSIEDQTPLTVGLSNGQHFMITGPLKKGKTTLLQTWLLAITASTSPENLYLYLADFTNDEVLFEFRNLPHVRQYIKSEDELIVGITAIQEELESRFSDRKEERSKASGRFYLQNFLSNYPIIVLAISDCGRMNGQLKNEKTKDALANMMRNYHDLGFHVIFTASAQDSTRTYDNKIINVWHEFPNGFLLGSSENSLGSAFNTDLPAEDRNKSLLPGDGYFITNCSAKKIRAATPWEGDLILPNWIEKIIELNKASKEVK